MFISRSVALFVHVFASFRGFVQFSLAFLGISHIGWSSVFQSLQSFTELQSKKAPAPYGVRTSFYILHISICNVALSLSLFHLFVLFSTDIFRQLYGICYNVCDKLLKVKCIFSVMTVLPVSASRACRAIPVTLPPRLAICLFSSLVSSMRSFPTIASHALNGSAFGDGMDWIIRRRCSVLATSVFLFFPSGANNFNCTIFSYTSTAPSLLSLRFKSLQYRRGLAVSAKTDMTSIIEKYHSSFSASHAVRIF